MNGWTHAAVRCDFRRHDFVHVDGVADVLQAIRAPIQKESQPIGKTRSFAEVH